MMETEGASDERRRGVADEAGLASAEASSPAQTSWLVDAGAEWLWETDSELRFSWLSGNFEQVTGITPEAVLGRFRFDFLDQVAKGGKSAIQHLETLQAHRQFRDFVYELAGGRPDCRWVSTTGHPRLDAGGGFLGYRGIARNVTGMKASFSELDTTDPEHHQAELFRVGQRASELLFDLERSLDSLNMGVVLLNADLKAEIINRAFYDIWKVAPEDVAVGSPFRALMDINRHNRIYDIEEAEWERYVASRLAEISSGDVAPREFRRADGCTVIYSVTALSGGKRLVSYYDVTEMKTREAELAQSHERSRLAEAVINAVKDPIFVKDADLKFVLVNNAFSSLFGKKPQAMVGRSGGNFLEGGDASRFEASELHVLETGEQYEVEENFEFAGIGKHRIVRKNRVSMASGNHYICGFLFDVTDLKRREQEVA
ncbi:MAG: PAS domain-containing protein, partial [Pseudaminobacter sp.]|nr:PAS domain-containing protein [Pseudaminobacter sp.]